MAKKFKSGLILKTIAALTFFVVGANAHFQMLIPSNSVIEDGANNKEILTYKFAHPFENHLMNMDKPNEVGVFVDGKKELISDLSAKKDGEFSYYQATYQIQKPGIYQFYIDPKPYFEPAEDVFIRHITKTIVDAYGVGEGWEKPVGLKAEIAALTRPYGLYAGNIFSGVVLYKGKPSSNTIVEVELYNTTGLKAPSEAYVTQQVMTNKNGEFSFAMPKAGWWGFAALIEDDETIQKDGKNYPIELGAVLWVEVKNY
ncbi:DUF4198 domain-containing protein [Campylobacter geochelonis]|uniref:DUF4198 domain-containing protein n=1 Tax=Campylobacter geochelonis TaxID=1780362 RepID=UPI000770B247|nr:Co2+ ABC transporter periplasmic protein [Campylobacter geochelonis]